MAIEMRNNLEKISNKKILISENYGSTVIKSLRSKGKEDICNRKSYKICHHGGNAEICKISNFGYRILCNRSPCNQAIDMKKIDNHNLRRQLNHLDSKTTSRPAIYEGESFRTPFQRMEQQWAAYNGPKSREKSFMWQHTKQQHQGVIGPHRGEDDYKVTVTEFFTNNLTRQSNEGSRQT